MSGGAGHIYDMIGRLRNNRALSKKRGYFHLKETYLRVSGKQKVNLTSASPEQLRMIRQKVVREEKIAVIKTFVVLVGSMIIGVAVCLILAKYYYLIA